jgi:hypothetical protein
MSRDTRRQEALAEGSARMPALSVRAIAMLAVVATSACAKELPGEVVGTYRVVMRLDENTCGLGALPFPSGEKYSVELRTDGPRGYWHLADSPPYPGTHDDGTFDFTYGQALELGSADAGTGGCIVLREELLRARIDAPATENAGADDAGVGDTATRDGGVAGTEASRDAGERDHLIGEHVISFRADPAGRCRDERGPLRDFERLPCRARYRLDGMPRSAF